MDVLYNSQSVCISASVCELYVCELYACVSSGWAYRHNRRMLGVLLYHNIHISLIEGGPFVDPETASRQLADSKPQQSSCLCLPVLWVYGYTQNHIGLLWMLEIKFSSSSTPQERFQAKSFPHPHMFCILSENCGPNLFAKIPVSSILFILYLPLIALFTLMSS